MAKQPKLPHTLHFENIGDCFWIGPAEYRCPNRGEYFVSGAIPAAYRARQHLTQEYWIVKPGTLVRSRAIATTRRPAGIPR